MLKLDIKRILINILKARKLKYFGHFIWLNNMHRTLLEGKIDGTRVRGRPRMSWYDNTKEWTGMRYKQATTTAMDRKSGGLLCHPKSKDKEHEEEGIDVRK